MVETYPRRFVIRNRDDLAQILVEGCQWSNGGISTLYHEVPWVKSSNGIHRALSGVSMDFDYPGNVEQVENLAAAIWGELHWLDMTNEEVEAAAAKAQEEITAAWTQARAEMNQIFFGARRPWGGAGHHVRARRGAGGRGRHGGDHPHRAGRRF